MHLIAALLALCIGGFIGITKSKLLRSRVTELEEIMVMLEKIQTYLQYERLPTGDILQRLAKSESLSHLVFLPDCAARMQEAVPFPVLWKQCVERHASFMSLTADDRQTLHMLGSVLGGSDAKSQLNGFALLDELTRQALTQAQESLSQKGKLYRSLGILGGVGIAILLV